MARSRLPAFARAAARFFGAACRGVVFFVADFLAGAAFFPLAPPLFDFGATTDFVRTTAALVRGFRAAAAFVRRFGVAPAFPARAADRLTLVFGLASPAPGALLPTGFFLLLAIGGQYTPSCVDDPESRSCYSCGCGSRR